MDTEPERRVKRFRKPLMILFVLTLMGAALGIGLNQVLAYFVAVPPAELAKIDPFGALPLGDSEEDVGSAPEVAAVGPRALSRSEYIDGILRRNIFDSEFIAKYDPDARVLEGEGSDLEETDLNLKLTHVWMVKPEAFSIAYIAEDEKDSESYGYNVGDKIQDAEVAQIQPTRVVLRRGDGREQRLELGEEGTGTPKPASREPSGDGDGDGDVTKLGENSYAVSKDLIDKNIGDIDGLSKMGRALLHRGPDGEYDGYRMSAIRRDTLPDKLGIRNGDIVHAVNGMPLTSVQGAMTAFQTMQNERKFNFEVTRRGQKVNMDYEIQ
jgi:type II secretion system protein C